MKADYEHNNLKLKIPPHYIEVMKEYVPITDERAFLVKIQFQQKTQCKKKPFLLKSYFLFINLETPSPRFNFPLGKYKEAL